ncbi:MAG: IS1595 family transposase [Bacteroidota bacterium]
MFQFKSLQEVVIRFSDEKVCEAYLEQLRWNGKPECPHCGCSKVYKLASVKQPYKCGDRFCGKKFSVRIGLIFEATNIPLSKWFIAIYLVTNHKKGISSLQLGRDLNITQKSAWHMIMRIREMMRVKTAVKMDNLVEVDEVYIGGKMKNKHNKIRAQYKQDGGYLSGHAGNKTGVMGLIDREKKSVTVKVIDSTKQTLKEMIKDHVQPSATIITDSLIAYRGLAKTFASHEIIHHEKNEFVRGDFYTNTVEGFFSLLKRSIFGIYHQCSHKHLARYCDETAYRYNTREIKDGERFTLSLKNSEGRLKYTTLIKKAEVTTTIPKWKIDAEENRQKWLNRPER